MFFHKTIIFNFVFPLFGENGHFEHFKLWNTCVHHNESFYYFIFTFLNCWSPDFMTLHFHYGNKRGNTNLNPFFFIFVARVAIFLSCEELTYIIWDLSVIFHEVSILEKLYNSDLFVSMAIMVI